MKILLTGSTSGIGWETFKDLWSEGHELILPVRNMKKAEDKLRKFGALERAHIYLMDLADLSSVRKAAENILLDHNHIDILINNAGGIYSPKMKSKDGINMSFSVNHLGHFLLTTELIKGLDKLPSKVINLSSEAHHIATVNPYDLGQNKSSSNFASYATSKLYNILFTKYLCYKYDTKGLKSFSVHPGAVKTQFGRDSGSFSKKIIQFSMLFFISPKKGAQTTLFLVQQDSSKLKNGGYYKNKKLSKSSKKSIQFELAEALWNFSDLEMKRITG